MTKIRTLHSWKFGDHTQFAWREGSDLIAFQADFCHERPFFDLLAAQCGFMRDEMVFSPAAGRSVRSTVIALCGPGRPVVFGKMVLATKSRPVAA